MSATFEGWEREEYICTRHCLFQTVKQESPLETNDNMGCISCSFLECGFSGYFQKTQICSFTVAVVASQQRAGKPVTTRHHLPHSAWVMSERPGGDRGAFVALSVPTSEKNLSHLGKNVFLFTWEHAVLAEWYSSIMSDTKDEGFSVDWHTVGSYKMLRICKFSTCNKYLRDHCDPLWSTILDFAPHTVGYVSHPWTEKKVMAVKRFNKATGIIEQIMCGTELIS